VVSDDPRLLQVRNPLPAQGGTDREPVEDARLYATFAVQTQERCVTAADYTAVALRYPQVLHAAAQVRWTGSWYTAFVYVQRSAARPADEPFRSHLARFLEGFRLAGQELELRPPYFVPLEVALDVTLKPGFDSNRVQGTLKTVFSSGLQADGSPGFFYPDNFNFNQPVYLSKVIAAAMAVPGVAEVDAVTFRRLDEPAPAVLPEFIAVQELEIVRLDNDPADPQRGSIRFNMKGGL
jgi:predicted phage baseplate assembly protein